MSFSSYCIRLSYSTMAKCTHEKCAKLLPGHLAYNHFSIFYRLHFGLVECCKHYHSNRKKNLSLCEIFAYTRPKFFSWYLFVKWCKTKPNWLLNLQKADQMNQHTHTHISWYALTGLDRSVLRANLTPYPTYHSFKWVWMMSINLR